MRCSHAVFSSQNFFASMNLGSTQGLRIGVFCAASLYVAPAGGPVVRVALPLLSRLFGLKPPVLAPVRRDNAASSSSSWPNPNVNFPVVGVLNRLSVGSSVYTSIGWSVFSSSSELAISFPRFASGVCNSCTVALLAVFSSFDLVWS